jgi:hypothetical protein
MRNTQINIFEGIVAQVCTTSFDGIKMCSLQFLLKNRVKKVFETINNWSFRLIPKKAKLCIG